MCGPAIGPLLIGATALSAVSTGLGALQSSAQARYQAKIAERNAGLEREAGRQEQENTREAALNQYRRMSQIEGAQRARAAAAGVGVDFGTAADVVAETQMLGREDVRRIYEQGAQNVKGRDIAASNFMAEASAQKQAATGALVKGALDFGSSVLGNAVQYKTLQRQYPGMF